MQVSKIVRPFADSGGSQYAIAALKDAVALFKYVTNDTQGYWAMGKFSRSLKIKANLLLQLRRGRLADEVIDLKLKGRNCSVVDIHDKASSIAISLKGMDTSLPSCQRYTQRYTNLKSRLRQYMGDFNNINEQKLARAADVDMPIAARRLDIVVRDPVTDDQARIFREIIAEGMSKREKVMVQFYTVADQMNRFVPWNTLP